MSISKGGQSVKPYVGGKEVKEAYVGNTLVYQSVPDTTYPPIVMNKGYTSLPFTLSNNSKVTLESGVGFYLTDKTYQYAAIAFTLPSGVNNPTLKLTINGEEIAKAVGRVGSSFKYLKVHAYPDKVVAGFDSGSSAGGNIAWPVDFGTFDLNTFILNKIEISY